MACASEPLTSDARLGATTVPSRRTYAPGEWYTCCAAVFAESLSHALHEPPSPRASALLWHRRSAPPTPPKFAEYIDCVTKTRARPVLHTVGGGVLVSAAITPASPLPPSVGGAASGGSDVAPSSPGLAGVPSVAPSFPASRIPAPGDSPPVTWLARPSVLTITEHAASEPKRAAQTTRRGARTSRAERACIGSSRSVHQSFPCFTRASARRSAHSRARNVGDFRVNVRA